MTGKRLVVELSESESVDSYAIDNSLERVKYLILQGQMSGNNPFFYMEDIKEEQWRENHE